MGVCVAFLVLTIGIVLYSLYDSRWKPKDPRFQPRDKIHLHNSVLEKTKHQLHMKIHHEVTVGYKEHFLIQLDPSAAQDLKQIEQEISELGFIIGDYIPHFVVTVFGKYSDITALNQHPAVNWVTKLEPKAKLLGSYEGNQYKFSKLGNNIALVTALTFTNNHTEISSLKNTWETQLLEQGLDVRTDLAHSKVIFSTDGHSQALPVANFLANQGEVRWVEILPEKKILNHDASLVTQGYSNDTPIWKMGLTGKGQLIGVGDTGIEHNSCYFFDNASVPYVRSQSDPIPVTGHRKIAAYWKLMDGIESPDGHGTHVCGISAGKAHESISPEELKSYNALAFESRLVFADSGCDTDSGCTCPPDTPCICNYFSNKKCSKLSGVIRLPTDLSKDYFAWYYKQGVRVQTNSWGSGNFHDFSMGYSADSQEIDSFVWKHKDFLILFAAGNSGSDYAYSSLTTESEAKNSLSVGASQTSLHGFNFADNMTNFQDVINMWKEELEKTYCCESCKTHDFQKCLSARSFSVEQCCRDESGLCTPDSVTLNHTCCGTQEFKDTYPSIGFSCCLECRRAYKRIRPEFYQSNNIASFSARGPTVDGRIKPDILAVGEKIVSAKATSHVCDSRMSYSDQLIVRQGTSMSAPVAASAAALVRQFFVDGYYPGNFAGSGPSVSPSAALLKAMLIHSTQNQDGYIYLGSQGLHWPLHPDKNRNMFSLHKTYLQGFGRIQLDSVIGNGTGLLIPELEDRSISQREVHQHCIKVNSFSKPFKVTLVWTDYPSTPLARYNLVNDLDLMLVGQKYEVILGNGEFSPVQSNKDEPDQSNNVEQVLLSEGADDLLFNVVVLGTLIPKGPQPYALVLSGDIEAGSGCIPWEEDLRPNVTKIQTPWKWIVATITLSSVLVALMAGFSMVLFRMSYQISQLRKELSNVYSLDVELSEPAYELLENDDF